jgi:hypothetical protein
MKTLNHNRGVGLIIVIMVVAFMLAVGLMLVTVTGTGPEVASNVYLQDQAFNAAEAGFDRAWYQLEANYIASGWVSFDGHYVTMPAGIDDPLDPNFYQTLTDVQLLALLDQNNDGSPDDPNVIFFKQPYVIGPSGAIDNKYTFTAFLVDDEAMGRGAPNPLDTLLICIGTVQHGDTVATARLMIELAVEGSGGNP